MGRLEGHGGAVNVVVPRVAVATNLRVDVRLATGHRRMALARHPRVKDLLWRGGNLSRDFEAVRHDGSPSAATVPTLISVDGDSPFVCLVRSVLDPPPRRARSRA